MATLKKTIGALEIYEPEDKTFNKYLLNDGHGDVKPNEGSTCRVNLSLVEPMALEDSDLGSYRLVQSSDVIIGEGDTPLSDVIDMVVMTMRCEEACYVKLHIDAKGKMQEGVPRDQQLKFNVILQSFTRCADVVELDIDAKLQRAQHHKDKGTELFKHSRVESAVKRYKRALAVINTIPNYNELTQYHQQQYALLKLQCYLNLGAAYLRYEQFQEVVDVCTHALEMDRTSVKALFRRGQSYAKLHLYQQAMFDFQCVLKIEPDNKAAQNQLSTLQSTQQKEKQIYKNMFQLSVTESDQP